MSGFGVALIEVIGAEDWDCGITLGVGSSLSILEKLRDLGNLLDEVRKGGVGGVADRRPCFTGAATFVSVIGSVARIVEPEEEDVMDSLNTGRPEGSVSFPEVEVPIPLCLVTGGREWTDGVSLEGNLEGEMTPGEWDDAEVGVDVRLKAPGDTEQRVDATLLLAA